MSLTLGPGDSYITEQFRQTIEAQVAGGKFNTAAAESALRNQVFVAIQPAVRKELDDAVETYELIHGDKPDEAEAFAAWDSDLDDVLFDLFDGDVKKLIGIDQLGAMATELKAWDADSRADMAQKIARQVANLIKITVPDAPAAGAGAPVVPEGYTSLAFDPLTAVAGNADLDYLMGVVRGNNRELDDLELYDLLNDAADSDDILAYSACMTLTGADMQARMLQSVIKGMSIADPAGWTDTLLRAGREPAPVTSSAATTVEALDLIGPGQVHYVTEAELLDAALNTSVGQILANGVMPGGSPIPPFEKPRRTRNRDAAPAETSGRNAAITAALAKFASLSSMTDAVVAEKLGISRSFYINVRQGKKQYEWSEEQAAAVSAMVAELAESASDLRTGLLDLEA